MHLGEAQSNSTFLYFTDSNLPFTIHKDYSVETIRLESRVNRLATCVPHKATLLLNIRPAREDISLNLLQKF